MMSWRSRQFWIGIIVSAACLWLALRDVPLANFQGALARATYWWLLPACAVQLIAIVARAQRWVILLAVQGRLADSFWAEGIGYLFTNIFPLRLGEPARIAVMSERCNLPFMQVAGSAIVERLLDVATIVVTLALVLPWMRVPEMVIRAGASFGALIILLVLAMLLLARFTSRVERVLTLAGSRVRFLPTDRLAERWRELVSGLITLSRWQVALPALGYSAVTWLFSIAMYWCVLRAFQPHSTLVEAAFMVVALAFAVSLPSSPGFIGVFQLVGQQALVIPFGSKYDAATALAVVLSAYLVYYLLTTALGIIGLLRLRQSFVKLGRALSTGQPDTRGA